MAKLSVIEREKKRAKLMLKYADSREMQIISSLPNSYVLKVANAQWYIRAVLRPNAYFFFSATKKYVYL